MINYKEIIDNLTDDKIKDLLDKFDIPYVDKGDHLVCKTACHNDDLDEASDKLYYYKNNHIFYCYTCCAGMSIFKFLKNFYETRQIEYDWTTDIYDIVIGCSSFNQFDFTPKKYHTIKDKYVVNKAIKLPIYSENALDCFIKHYPIEWLEDGITEKSMDKYGIKYSISQNKIIIPHRDVNGNLIGIRGRALNQEEVELIGKYMPVKIENTVYKHPLSMNLYGLYENKDNIRKNGVCFIAEAEKSVMQAENFSRDNCTVAVCGSQLNKYSLGILIKECHPREIVLCFDKEDNKEDKYFNKLYSMCKKYSNYASFSFIFDKHDKIKLKDSPFDNGEEVFEKLLSERVIVK